MNERTLEQQHVTETVALIHHEEEILQQNLEALSGTLSDQLKEVSERTIRTGDEEAFYESVIEYQQHEQEILLKYHSVESQQKRLKTLATMSGNPYFARIDFTEGKEAPETLYLGIASLRNLQEDTIVIDWRAPIANLYYEGELGATFYETEEDRYEVTLLLKRQFKIQEGQILSMVDTSEVINDEFLLEILDEASSSQMKNIVATIQKAQNQIIRDVTSKVMLIEGIAGSGKTSALLQRVAFLLYRHRKWLDEKQVLLFSPNHLFSDYISMVLPSLGESEVPTRTFRVFMGQLLASFEIEKEQEQEEVFLTGTESKAQRLKSGLALVKESQRYIQNITNLGPLFRNLTINGEVQISAAQMRQWYQETNPQLPLYQRTQLLQNKLYRKLGGLQKDEAKKKWLRDLAEEKLQQFFMDNPNQQDSDENVGRIRGQIRKQLAKRHFRNIERAIERYQFINYSKQYLHFLQNVPTAVLEENQLSISEWAQSIAETRESLKNRRLSQEDAVIFFLLARGIYPIDVEQKARFIFIDEMQDFPPAQVALLRTLYPQASMTLCGDLNQKVFGNESIVGSLADLFPTEAVTRYQLTTSYRSTKEITDFADQFLSEEDHVEMTARKGALPLVVSGPQLANYLQERLTTRDEQARYWRTAIICKTAEECQELYQYFSQELQQLSQLIISEEDFMKRSIIVIPAFLAKGLEFDRVFAWNIGEQFANQQDKLILYTICTRAMHELELLVPENASPLLAQADPKTYRKLIL